MVLVILGISKLIFMLMRNLEFLPIVNLYINDGIFNVKALITPQRLAWVAGNTITGNTKFVSSGCWRLAQVKLKDDYAAAYQKQGNHLTQFYNRRLVFVLDLRRDMQDFTALYLFCSGKIIILPAESLELKKQNFYFEKIVVETNASISRRKIKERYYLGAFNCLFFIKDKRSLYVIRNEQEVLQHVKCSYML